ncbi:MAG: hypothetical protein UU62_C0020G0004 [Candidatus Uhrbacteria bacterium GW2011_GWF2_41_40]|nr:MAG: hypothetical protein UU62_C0020G0004 [Candidatus Uhrbacteria bacterium GW2011_GWF2_41_40]
MRRWTGRRDGNIEVEMKKLPKINPGIGYNSGATNIALITTAALSFKSPRVAITLEMKINKRKIRRGELSTTNLLKTSA